MNSLNDINPQSQLRPSPDGHTTYSWQILDKAYKNMSSLYRMKLILPQIGRSIAEATKLRDIEHKRY